MLPKTVSARDARLPATYEDARQALDKCVKIDECKEWADKAAALASYAKQADDRTLQTLAERIRARAIERCGQLLAEMEASVGGRPSTKPGQAPTQVFRHQAARAAGLSDHERKTALRVANVPKEQFEALVESENPPTITQLADLGKKPRLVIDVLNGRNPEDYKKATSLIGAMRLFSESCRAIDLRAAFRGCAEHDLEKLVTWRRLIGVWLETFDATLEEMAHESDATLSGGSGSLQGENRDGRGRRAGVGHA